MRLKSILFLALVLSVSACMVNLKDVPSDGFVHTAYFWFKEDVSQSQINAFMADSEKLRDIESVDGFFAGRPAGTNRPIVENSYDYAVAFIFKDLSAHDYYQEHPLHKELIEKHSDIWERVMVTDIDR